jgi:DNA uptake protein ComE-like DNA-binding protein
MTEPGAWIWTGRQRLVLAIVVLALALIFGLRAVRNPARVSNPPGDGELSNDLATRIDPNTADWPAWAALPLIGEKRAKEIVAFRETWQAEHPGEACFEKPEDLTRVKGIGKVTIATLKPYLTFPQVEGSPNDQ